MICRKNGISRAVIGVHVHEGGLDALGLKEALAEAVRDNDGAEAQLFQGLGEHDRAQGAVGLRVAGHIEAGGQEDRASLPGEDLLSGVGQVGLRKVLP